MNELTLHVRNGILANLPKVREESKISKVYKPHLHYAQQAVVDPETDFKVSDIEIGKLLELDELFFNEQLKDTLDPFLSLCNLVASTRSEWYVRLPEWLTCERTKLAAGKLFQESVLMAYDNHYFKADDVPSYIDALSVVKPKLYVETPFNTFLGTSKVLVGLTPALDQDGVRGVFKAVVDLVDHINGGAVKDFKIDLSIDIMDFLTTGKFDPETAELNDSILLATIATCPTPFRYCLKYIYSKLVDGQVTTEAAKKSFSVLSSKALDLDSQYKAMVRLGAKPILAGKDMLTLINKQINLRELKGQLKARDIYYEDYSFFEAIRFFEDPKEALCKFLDGTDYIKDKLAAKEAA